MLEGVLLVIHVLSCLVLIGVILLQAGRGGGLADVFGAGSAQSFMGTRGSVYMTRATTAVAAIFMMTSLSLAILSVQRGKSLIPAATPQQGQPFVPLDLLDEAAAPETTEDPATTEEPTTPAEAYEPTQEAPPSDLE